MGCTLESVGAGGVGMGALDVAECFVSDADESWRGRGPERALEVVERMLLLRAVGDAVLVRGYF